MQPWISTLVSRSVRRTTETWCVMSQGLRSPHLHLSYSSQSPFLQWHSQAFSAHTLLSHSGSSQSFVALSLFVPCRHWASQSYPLLLERKRVQKEGQETHAITQKYTHTKEPTPSHKPAHTQMTQACRKTFFLQSSLSHGLGRASVPVLEVCTLCAILIHILISIFKAKRALLLIMDVVVFLPLCYFRLPRRIIVQQIVSLKKKKRNTHTHFFQAERGVK